MATKSLFSGMLNQKPIQPPQMKSAAIKVQKAPGAGEFAFLGQGDSLYRRPMTGHGNDVSQSVWGKMLNSKPKGP